MKLVRNASNNIKGVFKGGVQTPPPPPRFSDFFLKSEGKEVERKRVRRDGGGGKLLTYSWGLRFF